MDLHKDIGNRLFAWLEANGYEDIYVQGADSPNNVHGTSTVCMDQLVDGVALKDGVWEFFEIEPRSGLYKTHTKNQLFGMAKHPSPTWLVVLAMDVKIAQGKLIEWGLNSKIQLLGL